MSCMMIGCGDSRHKLTHFALGVCINRIMDEWKTIIIIPCDINLSYLRMNDVIFFIQDFNLKCF